MTNLTQIPTLSIIFMIITFLISLLLFFGLFFFLRKKMGLKMIPFWVGAGAFILFALILEQILHSFVLSPQPDGTHNLTRSPLLYGLYACLAAGIFEETARFLSFKLLKKKFPGSATAISYGIGHGGVEAFLLAGMAAISNLFVSFAINAGITDLLGENAQIQEMANLLAETAPPLFLVSGFERIVAVGLHISLSVLVWHSVNTKRKLWFYPLAILLHALFNAAAVLAQVGVITNIYVVEIILFVEVIALIYVVRLVHKKIYTAPEPREI